MSIVDVLLGRRHDNDWRSMALETSTAAMNTAAGHVEQVRDQLKGTLGTVRTECEGARANWSGGAEKAFQDLMTRYDESAQKLNTALTTIADKIQRPRPGVVVSLTTRFQR